MGIAKSSWKSRQQCSHLENGGKNEVIKNFNHALLMHMKKLKSR